jgi:hypothetical protein
MRQPTRGKQDWPSFRRTTLRLLARRAYRPIGRAYRAPKGFMILQRTNAALAVAACKTAPVRADCSALHRVSLVHLGGFS